MFEMFKNNVIICKQLRITQCQKIRHCLIQSHNARVAVTNYERVYREMNHFFVSHVYYTFLQEQIQSNVAVSRSIVQKRIQNSAKRLRWSFKENSQKNYL